MVELRLHDGRGSVRVRIPLIRSLVQRWLPSFDFDTANVRAEMYDGRFSRGVRIDVPDGPSVIFWTSQPDDVLAALAREAEVGQR
jgi:hypothetical protein